MYGSGRQRGDNMEAYPEDKFSGRPLPFDKAFIDINDWDLPITDVCSQRRNFPGFQEDNFFSLDDIKEGDTSGTTDTDAATHEYSNPGYTKIYSGMSNASVKGPKKANRTDPKHPWQGKTLSVGALGASRI